MSVKQHIVVPAGNSQAVAAANATAVNTCVATAIASAAASANASNGEQALALMCKLLSIWLQLAPTHQNLTEAWGPQEKYIHVHPEWERGPLSVTMPVHPSARQEGQWSPSSSVA